MFRKFALLGIAAMTYREPFMSRKSGGGAAPEDPEAALKLAKTELDRISAEIKTFAETAQKEIKATGVIATETKTAVDKALIDQTTALNEFQKRIAELEQKSVRRGAPDVVEIPKTPGQLLVEDEAVKKFCAEKQRGTIKVGTKSIIFSGDVPANVIPPMRSPGIAPLPLQQLRIRDLITVGRTSAPAYWYVQELGFVNRADVVSEGARKPTSEITLVLKAANVATIAHIFKAAKQLMDDLPALQSLVDTKLRYGLAFAEETQILYGDGTGINLHGIVPQATAFSPAFSVAMQQRIDDLMLALLQSELALYPASGIVVHPTDWARIVLTKDSQGRYIWANPVGVTGPTLWGRPVVTSMSLLKGTFLVGAFKEGALLLDREDANVQIATQNEDDFVKNMITLRAEQREALAVERPEAFVTGEFSDVT